MKKIYAILGALALVSLLGANAFAQENANRDENGKVVRGPYETNGAGSNWFIGIGAGLNGYIARDVDFQLGAFALEANVGKWFTPTVGARIGYRGIKNKFDYTSPRGVDYSEKWNQDIIHADFLWNISNALSGYKETRTWDFIPYATAGLIHNGTPRSWDFGAGFGLLNDIRLCNRVDLFIDLSAMVSRRNRINKEILPNGHRYSVLPGVTAGLFFNLGKTGFSRHSSITPVPVPFTVDQYNALKNRVAELEKENAALKNEIAALKKVKPDTVYVGSQSEVKSAATLYFDCGSAVLSSRELAHLDFYIDNVMKDSKQTFTLTGSADKGTGTAKRNQYLSEKRAEFVKNYLVKKGVDENKLVIKAEGDTNNRFDKPVLNRVVVIE